MPMVEATIADEDAIIGRNGKVSVQILDHTEEDI